MSHAFVARPLGRKPDPFGFDFTLAIPAGLNRFPDARAELNVLNSQSPAYVVPYEDSVTYAEAAAGEAELVTLEGAGHFEPIDPLAPEWPGVSALLHRLFGT